MLWFPKGGSGPHKTGKSYHPRLLWVPGRWDAKVRDLGKSTVQEIS